MHMVQDGGNTRVSPVPAPVTSHQELDRTGRFLLRNLNRGRPSRFPEIKRLISQDLPVHSAVELLASELTSELASQLTSEQAVELGNEAGQEIG